MNKILYLMHFLLDSADIFRFPLTLILNKKEKTSTNTGKIITIGIIVFLLSAFFTSDVVNRNNPTTLSRDLSQSLHPKISLSKKNMTIVIGIKNNANELLSDETVFEFYFTRFHKNNSNKNQETQSYKMELCTQEDFLENPEDFFELGINGSYCLPQVNFTLNGYWDELILDSVWIELKACQNSSENSNKCKSPQQINDYLQHTYVTVYLSNHNIDSSNYNSPISRSLKMYFHQVELKFSKTVSLYLKQTELKTDDGVIFESFHVIDSFVHSDLFLDISEFNQTENTVHKFVLYSSDLMTKVNRNYQKIQSLLAQLGGICNFIFLLGLMISKIENTYQMISILSNELFIFPNPSCLDSRRATPAEPCNSSSVFKPPTKKSKKEKKTNVSNNSKRTFLDKSFGREIIPLPHDKPFKPGIQISPLIAKSPIHKRIASIIGFKKSNSNEDKKKCPIIFDFEKMPIEKLENANFSNRLIHSNTPGDPNSSFSGRGRVLSSNSRENQKFSNLRIDLIRAAEKHTPWRERVMSIFKSNSEQTSPGLKKMDTVDKMKFENIEHYQKMKQKEHFFSIGFVGFIKLLFKNKTWCLNKEEKLFVKAEDQIQEELDVLKILQKLQDIDKLKRILLSDDQLYLFNLLSKPMIVLDKENSNSNRGSLECKDKRFKFSPKKKSFLNSDRMVKLYSSLIKRSDCSDVDKRIMKLLDEDVKCFLENDNCKK